MIEFIQRIKEGYSGQTNQFRIKNHENDFEQFLINDGFIKMTNDQVSVVKQVSSMTKIGGYNEVRLYIDQPFGSQRTPDFIIIIDGWVLYIELKRSKNSKITWNTGFPKDDYLYIFDSIKLGRVIFFGQHHPIFGGMENKYREMIQDMRKQCLDISGEYSDVFNKYFYLRPMLNDSGGYDVDGLYIQVINKLNDII